MTTNVDEVLRTSAPYLHEPVGTTEALADLVLETRRSVVVATRRRRRRRILGGVASLSILTVGGTAAASVLGWDTPWGRHPITSITYRLPSGGICEQRIGDLRIADQAAQQDAQQWLGQHQVSQIADVNTAIRQLRSGPEHWGSFVVGYGTAHYDADWEYDTAMWQAIDSAIHTKLVADGFSARLDVTWGSETHCTGANPHPEVPSWAK